MMESLSNTILKVKEIQDDQRRDGRITFCFNQNLTIIFSIKIFLHLVPEQEIK